MVPRRVGTDLATVRVWRWRIGWPGVRPVPHETVPCVRRRRLVALVIRSAADTAIALTFDDGPDPHHSPLILDELERLGVPATFFLVGRRAQAHPDLVRRMVEEGHAVGSHSSSHPEPWRPSLLSLARDYRLGRAQVEQAAGRPVPLFRPPFGYVDPTGALAMATARVRPWLWTIDSRDWVPAITSAEVVAEVTELRAGDVVLLHDAIERPLAQSTLDRSATCAALAGIVAFARERQLQFATLA